MKRLSLLLIILLIGCTDPINDFDIHVTPEAQEIPKLASDQWNMKEALTNSELKEAIPEFLGSLNIESNVVHEQTSGITVGWTPIIKGRSVNALLLTTGKKDNWQHKLIIKELLEEYYKRSPKHNGLPKEAIRQAFEFHQRQIAPSGSKKISSAQINTPKGQVNQDGYSQEKISNGEFIEICGYQLAYSYRKIESGEITYQEDTYYYICEYHYVHETPGDPIILDDTPIGGGGGPAPVRFDDQIDDSKLKPCMQNLLAQLKNQTKGVSFVIKTFSGGNTGYNWIVENANLPAGYNAVTPNNSYNSATKSVTSKFDASKFRNSSDLSVVRTMLHESVHAYLVSHFRMNVNAAQKTYADLVYDHNNQVYPNLSATHHAEFVRNWINKIGASLQEFAYNKGYNISNNQYFQDLAWGGLTDWPKRDSSGNIMKDSSGNTIFEETPWFKNSFPNATDRSRIKNNIDNELGKNGSSKQKGGNAGC